MNQVKTLQEKAVIVFLTIKKWSNRKYDKKVSKEVESNYHAFDAGRYNKILINQDAVNSISKIDGEARKFHYYNTLPWGDDGGRILPSKNYFDYMNGIDDLKRRFWIEVDKFLDSYDQYKSAAQSRLNGLFNESDYPDSYFLRRKYEFSYHVLPLPSGDDFRISLSESEIRKLSSNVEKRMMETQEYAMKSLWQRLYDAIEHIVERLSDNDARFKDSLINNVVELTGILPKLNITNDQNLERLRKDIEDKICTVTPAAIRANHGLRKHTASYAEKVLKDMKGYF